MLYFIIWISLCFIAASIASNKGRSGTGFFFLAFFLSPLVGVLAALICKENSEILLQNEIDSGTSKKCPYCAELIKAEAVICRYCNKELELSIASVKDLNSPYITQEGRFFKYKGMLYDSLEEAKKEAEKDT